MSATARPNVLFLLSDEHGFRYLGRRDPAAEGEPVRTPVLDGLAARGAEFDAAYCQMPLCTPSRMCLLSGREVARCGAWNNDSELAPDIPTLPGVLAGHGYATCLVGKMHFGGNRQFCGFQHRPYGDLAGGTGHQADPIAPERRHRARMRSRTADAGITEIPESLLQERVVAAETAAWIREHRHARPDTPWFLCASFSRPHFPLTAPRRHFERYWPRGVTPPKTGRGGDADGHPCAEGMRRGFRTEEIGEEEGRRARAAYFAGVDFLDEVLGDLLAVLERDGQLENTVVVYTSDHGEYAGEHGLWWKHGWHEACTRVPLIVQLPGHRDGSARPSRLATPVSLGDLFPTLCTLAGVPRPEGLDGSDLAAAVRAGREPERGPVFCDSLTPRWGKGCEMRVIRDGRYKYVGFRGCPDLLFDLEADPLERRNLAAAAAGPHAGPLARLRALAAETVDYEAAEKARIADEKRADAHRLKVDARDHNMYRMPDGRIVSGDAPLYRPLVVSDRPEELFADDPDGT